MPKGKHFHNPPKIGLTDYTVAVTPDGEVKASILRATYEQERAYIRTTRSLRRMCRKTALETGPSAQQATRGGFPTKRVKDDDIPSHRGVPHSNFLKRFKIVDRATCTAFGDIVYSAKVLVLHATRGWKVYA